MRQIWVNLLRSHLKCRNRKRIRNRHHLEIRLLNIIIVGMLRICHSIILRTVRLQFRSWWLVNNRIYWKRNRKVVKEIRKWINWKTRILKVRNDYPLNRNILNKLIWVNRKIRNRFRMKNPNMISWWIRIYRKIKTFYWIYIKGLIIKLRKKK